VIRHAALPALAAKGGACLPWRSVVLEGAAGWGRLHHAVSASAARGGARRRSRLPVGIPPQAAAGSRTGTFCRSATFCCLRSLPANASPSAHRGAGFRPCRRISGMNILISLFITVLVIGLVLYLVRMLPLDGNIKNVLQIIVIIIGIISLLRYLAVF
jgi:hypothetical protein